LEELVAIAALDKDIETFWTIFLDGCFYFLYIMELAERACNVFEIIAYKPNLIIA
jgi:hypothetical protein